MGKSFYRYIILGAVVLLFITLRLISLSNATVLEDHDSIFHMETIDIFRTGDIKQIINIDPDASLMYGFAGAVIGIFGWSTETSARLLSLIAAVGIFFISYIIGKRFHSHDASIFGLALIALNPVLIGLSIAILTEPFYVGMVYCGMLLFVLYHREHKLLPSFFTGLVFGLAFLTRLEGIIFLFFIPLMQGIYFIVQKRFQSEFKIYAAWSALFVAGFLLIAAIQVTWASYKMGSLAVDGRQVWTLLIHEPGDRSHNEKLLGLDYSPAQTNIGYLKANPRAIYAKTNVDITSVAAEYAKTVILNLEDLYNNRLITLVGFMVMIFFTLGIIHMYKSGKVYEVFLVFTFIIAGLIGPLLHNVVIRHILIISPIILIVAGIGLYSSTRYILSDMDCRRVYRYVLITVIYVLVLNVWVVSLNSTIKVPAINREYDLAVMQKMSEIIEEYNIVRGPVSVTARKGYLGYYAGIDHITIPFTDYAGLINYCKLNDIDFILLEHQLVHRFPFYEYFIDGAYGDQLTLLYDTTDRQGNNISLYKIDHY